ncbi:uncharacterized protein LOC133464850 [Cololabis saira]|uniref:uncharacterized protein LOC133464850 n=1 Tax=Cololabis saira TaxID=129043 RepID=UPI002AD3333F|nr:uncharacterized protein LOC133464850 [Cololabis saira]
MDGRPMEASAQVCETAFGGPALHKQRKILHFSSGETLEVEDSEEEEEEEQASNTTLFTEPAGRTKLSFRNAALLVGRISLLTCDFLGERLAGTLGLNEAKYQYAINRYHREHKTAGVQIQDPVRGRPEATHLSPGLDGSHYGATGGVNCSAKPQQNENEKHVSPGEGRHNRGYQPDEDNS